MLSRRKIVLAVFLASAGAGLLIPLVRAALPDPSPTDAVGLSDQASVTLQTPLRPVVGDSVGIGDRADTTLWGAIRPNQTDNVGIVETLSTSLRPVFRPAFNDAVGIADQATTTLRAAIRPGLNDSVSIGDHATTILRAAIRPAMVDTVGITDQASISLRTGPRITASPLALGFPDQPVTTTGAPQPVVVSNGGDLPLTVGALSISGDTPGDFAIASSTCNSPVPAGSQCTIAISFTPADAGRRAATLTIPSDAPGPAPQVSLGGVGLSGADLSAAITGAPNPVVAGTDLTYSVTITNRGPLPATNVTVSDALPVGETLASVSPGQGSCTSLPCNLGNLANGASATVTITVHTDPGLADGSTLSDTASVQADQPDSHPGDNAATVSTAVGARADLSLALTATPNPVPVNDRLTYTLTVGNGGPSNAGSVVVSDQLPSSVAFAAASDGGVYNALNRTVTWTLGTFVAGQPAKALSLAVTPGVVGALTNTATVSAVTTDPSAGNNNASRVVSVLTRATILTYGGDISKAYTDRAALSGSLRDAETGTLLDGKSISFVIGSQSTSATTSSGVASTTLAINQPSGSSSVRATFAGDATYGGSAASAAFTILLEDSQLSYSGDQVGQAGSALALRATVLDSAAAGYTGINPETVSGTIGDITKMWVAFDVYSGSQCLTGSPVATSYAQVTDSGPIGDGIGTASATFTSSTESTYCVLTRLVAGPSGAPNAWYVAPNAETANLSFYVNTGKFAVGAGLINDPTGVHGAFGFIARYDKYGLPRGQLGYVYRGLYSGPCQINGVSQTCTKVPVHFLILSTGVNGLTFNGSTATIRGSAAVFILRASDRALLATLQNDTYTAVVMDSGTTSGSGPDSFALTVSDRNGVLYKRVPTTSVQVGNIIIR